MTYEQFKASGKSGVYRADLDEWFFDGEEPPATVTKSTQSPTPAAELPPAETVAEPNTKIGKNNG